jgi:hypothetical protein
MSAAKRTKSHIAWLSHACGILAAIAAGFLFSAQLHHLAKTDTWTPGALLAGTYFAVFFIAAFATGWK